MIIFFAHPFGSSAVWACGEKRGYFLNDCDRWFTWMAAFFPFGPTSSFSSS